MHGQRRAEYKARQRDPKTALALEKKAQQWYALSAELAQRRTNTAASSREFHRQTLDLTGKLLLVNPDPMYLWNQRRELLSSSWSSTATTDQDAPSLSEEFELTARCLRRNPKAYASWLHRKWAVRRALSSGAGEPLLVTELALCRDLLLLDERNFHCWNYRRFLVAASAGLDDDDPHALDGSWGDDNDGDDGVVMGPQLTTHKHGGHQEKLGTGKVVRTSILRTEWDFTTDKIQANFSNYSAFHYRSKLLPLLLQARLRDKGHSTTGTVADAYAVRAELGREELLLVQQAVFTEPDDQTAWWYHRFVVASFLLPPDDDPASIRDYADVLRAEYESVQELVEAEDGRCKWGQLASHLLLDGLLSPTVGHDDDDEVRSWRTAREACLDTLADLDPPRRQRYRAMRRATTP